MKARTIFLLVLSIVASAHAQLPEGINPAAENLPPGFKGDSYYSLYSSLRISAKDNFETKGAFEERALDVIKGRFFAIPVPSRIDYDADLQKFLVRVSLFSASGGALLDTGNAKDGTVLVLGVRPVTKGEFLGKLAVATFPKEVSSGKKEEDVMLARPVVGEEQIKLSVSMSSQDARAARLSTLLVFQPEANEKLGFTLADAEVCDKIMSKPLPTSKVTARYIFAGEAEIWVWDEVAGRVLSKALIGRGRPWVYPGAVVVNDDHPTGVLDTRIRETTLWVNAPVSEVASYYESALKKRGLEPSRKDLGPESCIVTARDVRISIEQMNGKTVIGFQRGSSNLAPSFLP